MTLLFVGSITIPFVLGGIRLALKSPSIILGHKAHLNKSWRVLCSLMAILLMPFHSIIIHFKKHYVQLKLNSDPQNTKLRREKDTLTFHQRNLKKVEVGLETIYQMVGLNILLFASSSGTLTYNDLIFVLFKEEELEISFFSTAVLQIIGYLSIGYSFISCVRSHIGVLSAEREYFPVSSKCIAGLYTMFAITKRVMSMILFFAPALGLFDLLHHWLAEQTNWNPVLIQNFVDAGGNIQFGDSLPIPWYLIDRWERNTSVPPRMDGIYALANPDYFLAPPPFSMYTFFTLKEYFYIFFGALLSHMIIIIIIKRQFCFDYNGLNFEFVLHALENTNITYNLRQWDAPAGSAADHKKRMMSNCKEGIALILVSCIFDILHLLPLTILGMILNILL